MNENGRKDAAVLVRLTGVIFIFNRMIKPNK